MALVGHRVRELSLDSDERVDAHLLPGDSTIVLMERVSVAFTEVHDDRDPVNVTRLARNASTSTPPAVTMEFDGGFEGSETAPHRALGVTWDWQRGAARADLALPQPDDRLQNFMVRAIATARNGAEVTTAETWLRVHIHGSLRRLWLTPDPITVRRGCNASVRFTVLGEFDDGVVADLTQVEETVPDWRPRISWQSNDDSIATVSAGGRVEGVSAGDATITLRIVQPGALPDITASAVAHVVPPWADGAQLKLVAGDADRRSTAPNILFLGEAMERDDEDAFDRIVTSVIDRLGKNHLIDPWPWVRDAVNFWSLFTPRPAAGMSRRSEYYVEDPMADLRRGWTLPNPKRPANNATSWTLREMVYMIGLPVPDDADTAIDDMLPLLRTRFGDHVTKERIEGKYASWLKLAHRKYVDDVDSAYHLVKGERTRAHVPDSTDDPSIFALDPRRVNERDLRAFLGGLRHGADVIGANLWGEHGKDRALVCLLTRSTGRSVAMEDFFVCSLAHGARDDLEDARIGAVRISPFELPDAEVDDLDWLTNLFAHECGHAFGLGDEYGESDIDDKSPFASTQDSEAPFIERFPNLAALATLRVGTNEIDASRVKWGHWLRITDAVEVVGAPAVAGTRATVEIRAGQPQKFAVGANVRLRKRLCRRNAEGELAYRAHVSSGRLRVAERPDATHVVVEADGAPTTGETPLADFTTVFAAGEGTILFTPTRQKMPGHVDPVEVTVMSPLVVSHLSTKDRPLNAKDDEAYVCKLNFDAVQQPRTLPVLPNNKPCYEPLIIGLYDGGRRNHCGTFHPGGICMMRDHSHASDHRRFCSVCRYVLVDMIDPTQHGRLDQAYAKEYPH